MTFAQFWSALRTSAQHPTDPADSMPMWFQPEPCPELIRSRRQNRVILMFVSLVMLGLTWMPAALIFDAMPNFTFRAALRYGWPDTLGCLYVGCGALLLPLIWVQYRDPHGPLRHFASRCMQAGMLVAAVLWVFLAVSSFRLDQGQFTNLMLFFAATKFGFAFVAADSNNNELLLRCAPQPRE